MKKLGLLVMPLMAISLLASCGGGDDPGPTPSPTVVHNLVYVYDNDTEEIFTEKYINDEKTKEPTWTPTYAEHTFDKWYLNKQGEGTDEEFTFGKALTDKTTTIYAHWNPVIPTTYEVIFNFQDGKKGDDAVDSVNNIAGGTPFYSIIDNFETKQIAIPSDPAHFDFIGWGLTSDTQTKISDTYKVTDNIEVFAIFKPIATAKVTFDGTSTYCKLYLEDGTECVMGHPVIIPSGIDVKLTIKPNDGYLPIFRDNLIVTNKTSSSFIPLKQEITINVANDVNCSIKATTTKSKGELKDYSWSEINEISEGGVAPLVFKVGEEKIVSVNGVNHRIRIIGFDHDELSSSSVDNPEYAGITFEFANLISDKNGFSLATLWNWESGDSSTNENYLNSNLRKAIDGGGSQDTHLNWYQINGTKTSEEYKTSVLDMITSNPDNEELKDALKEVRKPIAIKSGTDYLVDNYTTKLFPLSYREMTEEPSSGAKEEGKTYEFYKEDGTKIKWQVNHNEGAKTSYMKIEEADKTWEPWSYAGYNFSTENYYGGLSWLRSPGTSYSSSAWNVDYDGSLDIYYSGVYSVAYAVAPAFCI